METKSRYDLMEEVKAQVITLFDQYDECLLRDQECLTKIINATTKCWQELDRDVLR